MRRMLILFAATFGAMAVAPAIASAEKIPIHSLDFQLTDNPRHVRYSDLQLTDAAQPLTLAGAHSNLFAHVNFCELVTPDKASPVFDCNPDPNVVDKRYPPARQPIRDLASSLPTGMLGNAAMTARCPEARFLAATCIGNSVDKYSDLGLPMEETAWPNTAAKFGYAGAFSQLGLEARINSLNADPFDEPARVGTSELLNTIAEREIALRDRTDAGLDATYKDFHAWSAFDETAFYRQFEVVCAQVGCPDKWVPGRPYYLTNPTACYKPAELGLAVNSVDDPSFTRVSDSEPITGCTPVSFLGVPLGGLITAQNPTLAKPSVEITPQDGGNDDAVQAGQGSGFQVAINVPEHVDEVDGPESIDDFNFSNNPDAAHRAPRVSSHTYRVETKLPAGMTLSVNAAKKLEACTDSQFGIDPVEPSDYAPGGALEGSKYDPASANFDPAFSPLRGNGEAAHCPAGSQIGNAKVYVPIADGDPTTPVVRFDPANVFAPDNGTVIPGGQEPLDGKVFLRRPDHSGAPTKDRPWQIFVALDDAGVHVKLAGKTYFEDGRIVTVFDQTPQTPFTRFELNFNGGTDSVLQAPRTCGTNEMQIKLYPWAGVLPPASGQPVQPPAEATAETVTDSFETTGCTDSFNPTTSGQNTPKSAGAFTRSAIKLRRDDSDDYIKNLQIQLPPGLVGSLTVPQCELSDVNADSCPQSTKVGRVVAKVGTGTDPLQIDGALYLAKPSVPGDAATVAAILPTKVGPIDLGPPVITLNRVQLDRKTAALTVTSNDIPASRDGIPLPVQEINIDVNRAGFFRNATSCQMAEVKVTYQSQDPDDPSDSKSHTASFADAATDCDKLAFQPKLRLIAGESGADQTGKRSHPTLRAVVTQEDGEANIKTARVVLPDALRPDTVNINRPGTLCLPDQLAAGQCPGSSIAGSAKATTPLLPDPIEGPVYLVQRTVGALPDLSILLSGAVSVDLLARNELKIPNTVNTFDSLPDVPQSSFALQVNGSKQRGILLNFFDLCSEAQSENLTADATFTAHSGATYRSKPKLEITGCERLAGKALVRSVKLKNKGKRVAVRLACPGKDDCKGSLSVKAKLKGKKRKLTLASGRYDLPAATNSMTITRPVKQKARLALKRVRRPKLSATLVPHQP